MRWLVDRPSIVEFGRSLHWLLAAPFSFKQTQAALEYASPPFLVLASAPLAKSSSTTSSDPCEAVLRRTVQTMHPLCSTRKFLVRQ